MLMLVVSGVGAGVSERGTAQATGTARVEIVVRDTSGSGVAGAEVAIIRGLKEARASGLTDERGRVALSMAGIASPRDDYQLVARKIGFLRAERFFRVTGDSLDFEIVLRRVAQLSPVVVTVEQDLKRKSYHVDADEIANTDRVMIDATDILTKLRPDMICGRSCSPLGAAALAARNPVRKCPTLAFQNPPRLTCPVDDTPPSVGTNVWVNGRWIRAIIPNEMAMARRTGMLAGLLPGSITVLSEIKPEHIAEMTYVDELDSSIGKVGSEGALFIVLKPGIHYDPGQPSYVVAEDTSAARKRAAAPATLPKYRYRVLGVFDQMSGEPIEGADVIDITTGTRARTTSTGTVSLIFLPEGTSPVRITKPGYDDLTVGVQIAVEAAEPLTLLMVRRPP